MSEISDKLLHELTKRWDVPMPFADAREALKEAYRKGFHAAIAKASVEAAAHASVNDMGLPRRIAESIVDLLRATDSGGEEQ